MCVGATLVYACEVVHLIEIVKIPQQSEAAMDRHRDDAIRDDEQADMQAWIATQWATLARRSQVRDLPCYRLRGHRRLLQVSRRGATLGMQQASGQRREPEHGGVGVHALLNPQPRVGSLAVMALVCRPTSRPHPTIARMVA